MIFHSLLDKKPFAGIIAGVVSLIVVGLTFLIYSRSLEGPFTFDDIANIAENSHIRLREITLHGLWDSGFGSPSSNRPVANVSFALNYFFHGYDVTGYHLANIVIHIINGFLLFFLMKITLEINKKNSSGPDLDKETSLCLPAFVATILWLVHPLHTESVSYVVQRMTSMASMFYVLSLLLYAYGRTSEGSWKKCILYCGCIGSGILAIGTKEIAITLPAFIFIYEWYFFQGLRRQWLRSQAVSFLLVAALSIVIMFLYFGSLDIWDKILIWYQVHGLTPIQRLLTEPRVVVYYISLLVFPHPSRLNLYYDFPLSHSPIDPVSTVFCMGAIAGLVCFSYLIAKKAPMLSFAILWFLGNLLIESSIIPLELVYEHRVYLPSMFLIPALGIWVFRLVKKEWVGVTILYAFICLGAYWTYERNTVWADKELLWRDCSLKSPNRAGAHYNLGLALSEKGKNKEAVKSYSRALELKPGYKEAHNNMGLALFALNKREEAIYHYLQAIKIDPSYIDACLNLAFSMQEMCQNGEAIKYYEKVIELDPRRADAFNNLGIVLFREGKTRDALFHLQKAVRIKPDYFDAHYNYGSILIKTGKTDEAIREFCTAVRLEPNNGNAHYNLGVALLEKGRLSAAIGQFSETLRINPHHAGAKHNLHAALAQRGKVDNAIRRVLAESKARPANPVLLKKLGDLYVIEGDFSRAFESYRAALSIQHDFADALHSLAVLYSITEDYENAQYYFNRAKDIQPGNPDIYYNLACMLAKRNKPEESVKWLEQAIRMGFNNWRLLETDTDLESIRDTDYYDKIIRRKGRMISSAGN